MRESLVTDDRLAAIYAFVSLSGWRLLDLDHVESPHHGHSIFDGARSVVLGFTFNRRLMPRGDWAYRCERAHTCSLASHLRGIEGGFWSELDALDALIAHLTAGEA